MLLVHLDIGFSNYGECNLAEKGTTLGLDKLRCVDPLPQVVGALEYLPFQAGSISEITMWNVVPDLVPWDVALPELKRVLHPSGVLTVGTSHGPKIWKFRAGEIMRFDGVT